MLWYHLQRRSLSVPRAFVKRGLYDGVEMKGDFRDLYILLEMCQAEFELCPALLGNRNTRLGIHICAAPGAVGELLALGACIKVWGKATVKVKLKDFVR
jgi:hypothetical protein